jgi:hypothetical protein
MKTRNNINIWNINALLMLPLALTSCSFHEYNNETIDAHRQCCAKLGQPFDLFYVFGSHQDPNIKYLTQSNVNDAQQALDLVKFFVQKQKCNLKDPKYKDVVDRATDVVCYHGAQFLPVLRLLVQKGAPLNNHLVLRSVQRHDGCSLEALRFFIEECKMSPDYTAANGESAINEAALHPDAAFVRELIKHGADVNLGRPIFTAAQWHNADAFDALLEAGADLGEMDCGAAQAWTLLQEAADLGEMDRGAVQTWTLLHAASISGTCSCCLGTGQARIIKKLLELGFDVNKQDGAGKTPLHYAYKHSFNTEDSLAAIELLLTAKGVNPFIKDRSGKTPFEGMGNVGWWQKKVLLIKKLEKRIRHM